MPNTYVRFEQHETPEEMFASLARLFGEHVNGETRWVTFAADAGVTLTFYAEKAAETSE